MIIDTGAPMHREQWLEKAYSVVDPEDVKWIFLSHDDGDHTGGLLDALEMSPHATFVTNFFSVERLGPEIHEAFDTARELAGKPRIPGPGQETLDDLVGQILAVG